MSKKTIMTEALRNTIESMLRSGKTTVDIMYDTNVSAYRISKIRKDLMKRGWGCLWHTDEYLGDKGFA